MKNQKFCVIGLGYFGYNLAVYLTEQGAEVLAIDNKPDIIDLIKDKVSVAVQANSSDIKVLRNLGINDMDAVIVAIGEDFEASINTLANLQEIGSKRVIARVISPIHERLMKLMGVNEILLPEAEAAKHLTNKLVIPDLLDFIELDNNYGIFEINAPNAFIGKSLIEINLRSNFNLNLVTLKKETKKGLFFKIEKDSIIGIPSPEYVFNEQDILVIFGSKKDIEKFMNVHR